jgi:hypothetical protein
VSLLKLNFQGFEIPFIDIKNILKIKLENIFLNIAKNIFKDYQTVEHKRL